MTVIAGWHNAKEAWIGGDSGAFDEDSVVLTEIKVWKTDDYLLGASGGFRLAEVAYESAIGDPHKLRDHLEAWWNENSSSQAENDTQILVISTSGVWIIGNDFSVVRCRETYGAVGAGGLSAMSALFALQGVNMSGKDRLTTALKATAYHTTQVRAPFKVISL
jgi:hypothetical protein